MAEEQGQGPDLTVDLTRLPVFEDVDPPDSGPNSGLDTGNGVGEAPTRPRRDDRPRWDDHYREGGGARMTPAERLAAYGTPAPAADSHAPQGSAHARPEPAAVTPGPWTAPQHHRDDSQDSAATTTSPGGGIDWGLVVAFRQRAADQLTQATKGREDLLEEERRELGRSIILELLQEAALAADFDGGATITTEHQQRLAKAIFDALFGLGRFQPLVDDTDLENIEVYGHDVHLVHSDGLITRGEPVADSDEELIEALVFMAARSGGSERPFSPAEPFLDLQLPGKHRLAAQAWITPWPTVVIRRHRLIDVTLEDMVERDVMDNGLKSFLTAAVKARKSIVVSGAQGFGKTTLVRALCSAIGPEEAIGTIETEYELFLHEMDGRHPRCIPWEARPGSGEMGPDGRRLGEVTLQEIFHRALRMNRSRVIVGEVRGPEVIPMFKAMQSGAGSLSTTHASSARAAIERLVGCALEAGSQINEAWAYRQVAEHINLIVQLQMADTFDPATGRGYRRRYISEVIALSPGIENPNQPQITDVYAPGPDGSAAPHFMPETLTGLADYGFALDDYRRRQPDLSPDTPRRAR